jgi:hypothetical protein
MVRISIIYNQSIRTRQKKNAMLLLIAGKSMDVLDRFLLRKATAVAAATVITVSRYAITYNNDAS